MTKRLLAVSVCLLLLLTSGCEFFAAPSASTTPAATPEVTVEPTAASTTVAAATETVAPTDTPTEAPTVAPTATADSTEGMIFPDSDTRLLMLSELINSDMNLDKLAFARNEIYAREGRSFTTKKYADYYSALSWYTVDPSYSDSKLTPTENKNIHTISIAEDMYSGKLDYVPTNTELDFDLDGAPETLTYSAPDDNHMNIQIKDGATTTKWTVDCENPSKKVWLGDINNSDGMLDLFVDEAGPSDDYAVHIAGIKHHAFLSRGNAIPGSIGKDSSTSKKNPFKPDGKGTITTLGRIDTVGTDFFIVKYKLNSSGKLAFVKQSSYNFVLYSSDHYMVTTKVAIPLMKTTNALSTVLLTVPAGTSVELVSTDTVKWVKVKAPGGTGWLQLSSPLHLANPAIDTMDAFDGLMMAD